MGACHRSGIHKVACGLPSLVRSIALVAVAAAATAVVTGAAEMTSVASSGAAAQSIVMPQNGDVRLHRSTPLDLVARQPLDGFEPSAIRRLQRQRRRSQNVAVSAGLVAVVCLAVAFAVFQCARKALLPRLFGSPGKRALSDSDSDEHSVDVCIEEEIDESDGSSGGAEARPTEVAGEATALEALEELRSLITLGVQTAPHVPAESRGVLVVLLLTVCTQELALYGVYSTPQIEVERQRAIDFVLQEGAHALAQLDTLQAYFTVRRGRDMLELLQRFREAPANADSGGLAVEATISEYRIKQCSYALQQLQPWVQRFTSIPMQVVRAALKLVSCVRHSGKRRLKQDKGASAWVETVQAAHGFFGIAEPAYRRKFCRPPKTLAEEMGEGSRRYHQFRTQLDSSVQLAFALQQPGQRMLEQPQKREQQQLQELEPPQQQHPEIPGEGVTPSHPSRPPSGARRRSSSATTSSVLRPPTLQSTQSPRADSHRHIPTAHPERLEHPPSWSAPRRKKTLQETNEQQQPSPASSTLDSGLRAAIAPPFCSPFWCSSTIVFCNNFLFAETTTSPINSASSYRHAPTYSHCSS
ncbi:uncharacterized protein EMH_0041040 [Eimeria mitis]|uniref:Transmembrane protein n=1 Tax=Eimeria mitis TaxID=44415 RepID=U6JSN0_9EIME|nr:uncharacterized protein EMH_0041040 [Eimeria mitis]CDJ28460.1 hypothetical protein, conserved [Eimeria mitis]